MFLQPCQSIYWNILPDFIGASSSEKKTEKSWTALKDFLRTLSVFRRIWLQNHILKTKSKISKKFSLYCGVGPLRYKELLKIGNTSNKNKVRKNTENYGQTENYIQVS